MRTIQTLALAVIATLGGCTNGDDPEAAAEEDVLDDLDQKTDSLKRPTMMGEVGSDAPVEGELAADARVQMWTFEVAEASCMTGFTRPPSEDHADVDTVIYLFRQKPDGGYGRYLNRNDDGYLDVGPTGGDAVWESIQPWSAIEREIDPGSYALVVKGKLRATEGAYALHLQLAQDVRCGQD